MSSARASLLPQGASLRHWIEKRIGGEIAFTQDAKGQMVVHLLDAARAIVKARFLELERRAPPMTRTSIDPEGQRAFLNRLPANSLLPAELEMRRVLIAYLEDWPMQARKMGKPETWPALSMAGNNPAVQQAKRAFMPGEVSLKEWIDKRIGGEIVTRMGKDNQFEFALAEGTSALADDESVLRDQKRQEFFDALPPDGFLPDEERLREAILRFVGEWKGTTPATLSAMGSDPEIREVRATFLPKGCGVSLREWIDCRIGAEVDAWQPDVNTSELAICLKGERPEFSGVAQTRKRKESEMTGKGGKGNGKHSDKSFDKGFGKGGKGGKGKGSKGGKGSSEPPAKRAR